MDLIGKLNELSKEELFAWIGYFLFITLGFLVFLGISIYAKHRNRYCSSNRALYQAMQRADGTIEIPITRKTINDNSMMKKAVAAKKEKVSKQNKESFSLFDRMW